MSGLQKERRPAEPASVRDVVLVTGATGFIGRWIARGLLDRGERVVALTRSGNLPPLLNDCIAVRSDLSDAEGVAELFRTFEVVRVIHAAAVVGESRARAEPLATVRTNVCGTAILLEAARLGGVKRFVLVSTGSAYGVRSYSPTALAEDTPPLRPLPNLYAATKVMAEDLCGTYSAAYDLSTVSVRVSRVFGSGRANPVILPVDDLLQDALRGGPIRVTPDMELPTDYTYVKDVVGGVVAILTASELGHTLYNLSGGAPRSGPEAADAVRQLFPGVQVKFEPKSSKRAYPYPRPPLDIRRLAEDVGFLPAYDLEAGLRDHLAEMGQSSEIHAG